MKLINKSIDFQKWEMFFFFENEKWEMLMDILRAFVSEPF